MGAPIVSEWLPLSANPVQSDVYGIRRQPEQSGYLAVPVASRCESSNLISLRLSLYEQQRDKVRQSHQVRIPGRDGVGSSPGSTFSSSGHGRFLSSS